MDGFSAICKIKNFPVFRDVFVNRISVVLADDVLYGIQKIAWPFILLICR